jgi:hypothetical protein
MQKNFRKIVFFIILLIVYFTGIAFAECLNAADCSEGKICVAGECSVCNQKNSGLPCSDDSKNDYNNDGICTYDGLCSESVVCLDISLNKHFFGCQCANGSPCSIRPFGEFNTNGVCLNEKCESKYCSSSNPLIPQICSSIEITCSESNEGKFCDYVGDGEFAPEGKRCYSGNCSKEAILQKKEEGEKQEKKIDNPFFPNQETIQENTSKISLAELIFGKIIFDRNLFAAFMLLALIGSYFVFLKTGMFFPTNASTTQKQLALVKRFLAAAFLFLLTFQLGRLSNYYISFLFVILVVLSIIMSDNYLRKVKGQRQAIKV